MIVGLVVAWRWGATLLPDEVRGWAEHLPGVASSGSVEPSPSDAAAAVARYEALVGGASGGEVRLTDAEVSGALRYRVPEAVPDILDRPLVTFHDEEVRIQGSVLLRDLPPVPAPDRLAGVLPDTVTLTVQGPLLPLEAGTAAVVVQRMQASGVPVTARLRPRVLDVLGRPDRRDLPSDAFPISLPPGVSRAFLDGDALVLEDGG